MLFENFYIKAPIEMLTIPLPLEAFLKEDGSYYTINEYVASRGHAVERFTNDGTMFMKGFGFNVANFDSMRSQFTNFGLVENESIFILSLEEALEELKKPEWNNEAN